MKDLIFALDTLIDPNEVVNKSNGSWTFGSIQHNNWIKST